MEGFIDPFIERIATDLDVDKRSAAAAILHFVDRLPHAEVGRRLGLPTVEAQALAYDGLRSIKEAADDLPLREWRAAAPFN